MEKCRILLLGVGNFGISWALSVLPEVTDQAELVAAVDSRKERLDMLPETVKKFQDLEEAVSRIRPDLVINATQPSAHTATTQFLLEHHIPVLCEKPIADTLESAYAMGETYNHTGGFLMIGENYRFSPVMRKAYNVLHSGILGDIHHLRCHFCHDHPDYSMFYHGQLEHPLLQDVTIHHLDLARYLSGQEGLLMWCEEQCAPYSWYGTRLALATLLVEMTRGVTFEYSGTLASPVATTPWNGNWEIECETGILQIRNDELTMIRKGSEEHIPVPDAGQDSRVIMLRHACQRLEDGWAGETEFADNILTFLMMQSAIDSSMCGHTVRCR